MPCDLVNHCEQLVSIESLTWQRDTWPMPRSLQRINPAIALERFREEVLAKWKSGVDRRDRTYWTWCALSARMILPSRDMLSYLRVNQWIAHLPENYP